MIPMPQNPTGYVGSVAVIPLGRAGLFTDTAQSEIPISGLIRANNVTFYNQIAQKDYGSRIWNSTPMPAGVVRALEMYPDSQSQLQRIFAFCKDGNVYKYNNYFTRATVTPTGTAPALLNPNNYNAMVLGGNELLNFPKKLFLMDGYDPVQVVSGDAVTRSNIALPALDWTGTSQPFGGIIHRGALYAWGNRNNPHQVYASSVSNHEDFQTGGSSFTYSIYPGESDGIVCGGVFRGRLYLFKYPRGIYYLVDDDPSRANWFFTKHADDFGACSPQSALVAMNDLVVANNYGSITSMTAALVFGDTMNSDVFHVKNCFQFAQDQIRPDAVTTRSMVYYAKKKQLLISFQSTIGNEPDRIAVIDFKNAENIPRVAWLDKDQPNCLFLVRDSVKVGKPFYGANDGNLYEMDVPDLWVGSETDTTLQSAYTFDIQTPHMDFSQENVYLGSQVKLFEHLEIMYEPTGDWDVSIGVYIDGRFQGTYTCNLSARSDLSEMPLNSSPIDGLAGFYRKFPICGEGRSISLRFYNSGLGQGVRLIRALVYYRLSGQQQMVG